MSSGRAGSSFYVNMKPDVQFLVEFYSNDVIVSRIVP
jgi:hypothetical protein